MDFDEHSYEGQAFQNIVFTEVDLSGAGCPIRCTSTRHTYRPGGSGQTRNWHLSFYRDSRR